MSHVETVRIIREGHPNEYVVINRDDLKPDDKLYDETAENQAQEPDDADGSTDEDGEQAPPVVEIKRGQGGKYNVLVDGEVVTDEPMAKADAEAMAETLRG